MAYKFQKNNTSGRYEIVVSGFEKGIADSPHDGIANMRNLSIDYYKGSAYVNYKRQACTISGGSMKKPMWAVTSPGGYIYILDSSGQVWQQSAPNSSTFNLITGNPSTGASGQGLAYWNNYLFVWRANFIDICGDGTGDTGITSSKWNASATPSNATWPIENLGAGASFTLTGSLSAGATTGTISSYTNAAGAQSTWVYPSGTYRMTLSTGQYIYASLTFGSASFSFAPSVATGGATSAVSAVTAVLHNTYVGPNSQTTSQLNMTRISSNDGNLYFTNGSGAGALTTPNTGEQFLLSKPGTYSFNIEAVGVPRSETAVWLEDLAENMVIATNKNLYQWDYTLNGTVSNPVPVPEPIAKVVNKLNKIYVFAGQKGNIYVSNGYAATLLRKIPDYITSLGGNSGTATSAIDPIWTWGGVIVHRNKILFQAFGQNSNTADGLISGTFSIDPDKEGVPLTFEGQNSFGLVSSTTTGQGVLIDNMPSANGNDSYYSGWSDGISNAGGIDYNNTTLYSSYEPMFETDLIPTGTYLDQVTMQNIEFKLDAPLASGDKIKISGRGSLSEPYTLIGETTTSVLSDPYTSTTIQNNQWIQLLVQLSCNSSASTSSFNRINEVRIRL